MANKIKPTLYLGLGVAGSSLIAKAASVLRSRNSTEALVATDLCIGNNGLIQSYFKDKKYFEFPFENKPDADGCYLCNYEYFVNREDDITALIRNQITEITNIDNNRSLVSAGYEWGDPQVLIVAETGDPIGSSILMGFTKIIKRILKESNYAYSQISCLYLLPDLFHQSDFYGSAYEISENYTPDEIVEPMQKDAQSAQNQSINYKSINVEGKETSVFVKAPKHKHDVDVQDIDQGYIGNCYFLALLGAIAKTQPDHIKDLLIDNKDGTYTIRFFKESGGFNYITIDDKFWLNEKGEPIYSRVNDVNPNQIELWVLLFEKAWAKMHNGYEHIEGGSDLKQNYIYALTGNQHERIKIDEFISEDNLFDKLINHFKKENQAATFTSKAVGDEHDDEDLVYNHAYILKDVSTQNKTVNLYNPHGENHFYNIGFDFLKNHFRSCNLYNTQKLDAMASKKSKLIRDFAYARSFAFVSELDAELERLEEKGTRLIDHNFVIGSKNHKNISLGGFVDMKACLSEFSLMLMDENFATKYLNVHLEEEVEGKTNRFSSIGFSTLLWPEEKFIDGLVNKGKSEILNEIQSQFRNQKYDINEITGSQKQFYNAQEYDSIVDKIALMEKGGRPIFEDFKFTGKRDQEVVLDSFYESVQKQAETFEFEQFGNKTVQALNERKDQLSKKYNTDLNAKTEALIKSNGINYAHAFVSLLLRDDCPNIYGQLLDKPLDLRSLESKAQDFYKSRTSLPEKQKESEALFTDLRNNEKQINYLTNQMDDKRDELLVEMGKVGAGEKESTAELTRLQAELASRFEALEEMKAKVETQRANYEGTLKDIERIKLMLESGDFRKKIREADLENLQLKKYEVKEQLEANDKVRAKVLEEVEQMKLAKEKLLKRLLIFLPALFFGIPALIAGYLEIFNPEVTKVIADLAETSKALLYTEVGLFALVVYAIWAFFKYRKQIAKPFADVRLRHKEANNEKVLLLNNYCDAENEAFKLKFEHIKNAYAYEATENIVKNAKSIKANIEDFKGRIIHQYEKTEDKNDALYFANDIFESNIVQLEDIAHFKETATASDFFIDKEERSLLHFYKKYLSSKAIEDLNAQLNSFLSEKYNHLKNKSIYDFLLRDNYIQSKNSTETRMKLLNDASQVYINLKDFGTGDPTEEMSAIYQFDINERDALTVREKIESSGLQSQSKIENGNKNKLSIFRAKRGFPGFKITLLDECKTILDDLEKNSNFEKSHFYINNSFLSYDLYPGSITMGNKNDETRIAFVKGQVLELIQKRGNEYRYLRDTIGKTEKEAVNYFKSLKGEADFQQLQTQIIRNEERLSAKKIAEKIEAFNQQDLSIIDKDILDDWIRRLI